MIKDASIVVQKLPCRASLFFSIYNKAYYFLRIITSTREDEERKIWTKSEWKKNLNEIGMKEKSGQLSMCKYSYRNVQFSQCSYKKREMDLNSPAYKNNGNWIINKPWPLSPLSHRLSIHFNGTIVKSGRLFVVFVSVSLSVHVR